MKDKDFLVLEKLKAFPKITVKRALKRLNLGSQFGPKLIIVVRQVRNYNIITIVHQVLSNKRNYGKQIVN